MAVLILFGVFLLGGVAVYVFSDDFWERWSDTKDFWGFLWYLPGLLREVETFAKQQEAMPEEEEELCEQDVKGIAVKREDLCQRWLKEGGTEETFVAAEAGLHRRGWLVKVTGRGEPRRRLTWEAYLARREDGVGAEERRFLDIMVVLLEEKKHQGLSEKMERVSGIRLSRESDHIVWMKEDEFLEILGKVGLRGEDGEHFKEQLLYRGVWTSQGKKGKKKGLSLREARDLLQQERRFFWTSLGLVVAAVLPLGLMYISAVVAMLGQIAPPVALLAGVVLGSYVELSHRLEMQRGALRLGVLNDAATVQGNALQPIFIGLLLGHKGYPYRSSYGWGIPHKEKGWPLSSLKLELLMKVRVYVLAILSVLLVLLVSSLFARDSELMASLNPFIGYYTLLISFAMWTWVSRRGKLPVLRAKLLIYHPDEGLGKGWLSSFFEEPQTEKFLQKEDLVGLQRSYAALRLDKPLFLEITARKSTYGFYNQKSSFRLFQQGLEKMTLGENDEAGKSAFRLLNEKYGLKITKDGETEEEESFVEDAEQ